MKKISRAQLLRGNWGGDQAVVNPPWALPTTEFTATCNGCGECVDACPQNILKFSPNILPQVDFKLGECTFCGDCAAACPVGALHRGESSVEQPWQASIEIAGKCLANKQITCDRCVERCSTGAITAKPALPGRLQITVRTQLCNGCGACITSCPVDAISIQVSSARVNPGWALNRNSQ